MLFRSVSDFDFDKIFDEADWFHFSGITPAISENARVIVLEALKAAKRKGVTVSCDLNYRNKLWTVNQAKQVMPQLADKYQFQYVISSLRQSHTSSYHDFSGCIYDGENFYTAKKYEISPMIDRVGGGDAFAAGIIFAILSGKETKDVIEFAVAASALKHTIPGDANLSSVEEIEHLIKGNGIGRVQR